MRLPTGTVTFLRTDVAKVSELGAYAATMVDQDAGVGADAPA